MQEALACADEERRRTERETGERERWQEEQQRFDVLLPQWRQSAKVPRQTLEHFVVNDAMRGLWERLAQRGSSG